MKLSLYCISLVKWWHMMATGRAASYHTLTYNPSLFSHSHSLIPHAVFYLYVGIFNTYTRHVFTAHQTLGALITPNCIHICIRVVKPHVITLSIHATFLLRLKAVIFGLTYTGQLNLAAASCTGGQSGKAQAAACIYVQ